MGRPVHPHIITSDSALGGSEIQSSLRFHNNDNTRLVRTIASTSNRRTFTYSWWLKRTMNSTEQYCWYVGSTSGTPYLDARFEVAHEYQLQIQDYTPSRPIRFITTRKFNDATAWYHFVFAVDTTQGTASNRAKIYVNGVQETSFGTETYPSQNYDSSANVSGHIQVWGSNKEGNSNDLDGFLAEAHLVDGQQLEPTAFGYTEPQTGIWRPKKYEGTHGTNGFYLDFSDNSAATAAALGKDRSGNANDFTPSNLHMNTEIVTNGEFSSDSGWTKDNNWSITGGKLVANGTSGNVYQTISVVSGVTYIMTATVDFSADSSVTNTTIGFRNTGNSSYYIYRGGSYWTASAVNQLNFQWTSTVTGNVRVRCYTEDTITIDNWSVKAVSDSVLDTPANDVCTLDPLHLFTHNCTLSNGNLKATGPNQNFPGAAANIALSSGKWYYEFVINTKTSVPMCGVCRYNYLSGGAGRILYRAGGHYVMHDGSEPTDPDSFDVGDIIGVAIDLDDTAGNIRFYKNGTLQTVNSNLNSLKSQLGISTFGGGLYPYIQMYHNDVCTVNFGQRPFSYTPPSGHRSISLNNLAATPSIIRPEKHMKTLVWAGNSTNNRVITGLEFQPDLVWIKKRNVSIMSHFFISSAQTYTSSGTGNGNVGAFQSGTNSTDGVGTTSDGGFVSFNRDGFTLGKGNNDADSGNAAYQRMNVNGANYVGWCWKAGGNSNTFNVDGTGYASASAAGITEGNLALTGASVNKEAGFSIVKFNANNSASATIGHGLNSKPELIIVKDTANSDDWQTKFVDDNTYFSLNSTGNGSASYPDYTATDTVINLGYTWNNGSGLHVAYSWHSVPGYSKIGYYTGNADSNGPLIYTGFPIGWLMIKRSNGTGPFNIWDVSREPNGNSRDKNLDASSSAYEDTGRTIDFLSNGFKIRNSGTEMNNGNYLYLAFAKQSGTTSYQTGPNAQ